MAGDLSIEELRELLRLEDGGFLYWNWRSERWFNATPTRTPKILCALWNGRHADKRALTATTNGYLVGSILDVPHYAHRVVFALHHGRWPKGQIDHHDGNRGNNDPSNLRDATPEENQLNVGSRGGSSRFCGVSKTRSGRWAAFTSVKRRSVYLGSFSTEEDAARAYDAHAIATHGQYARLNLPLGETQSAMARAGLLAVKGAA